ncbi:hypothetical protein L6452_17965 [Arctium lappa]|uniref:Uncharacterized protein n=1 Tax=Arctium lappa TaxID=4217 RepID=A0ACB9C4X8_ARCLA|nr:hypothetical protein L6452_17965 [Arctium lappa]
MDPTTVLPPSPEKSPPPQNPHSATDAIIDSSALDRHQEAEPSTSRNVDNFRALVMKLAGRLLPAHQSLIGRRFDDIFPDELLVPDHPPYADYNNFGVISSGRKDRKRLDNRLADADA